MFHISNLISFALFSALLFVGSACQNNNTSEVHPQSSYTLEISFNRIASGLLNPFQATVTLKKDGQPLSGQTISVSVANVNQTTSSITDQGDGTYTFTVTPSKTGEYPVTVSFTKDLSTASITRTALVLQGVHSDWGQPMSVPGYVNTVGYEDGVTISPDGEYLFVQTGPYRFSSLFVYNEPRATGGCGGDRLNPSKCTHPWINETMGSYTAPERPGFFSGRFSDTTQLHNAASWGVGIDQAPNYALSTMFYGFKKQSDGSFKEPFYLAFHDLNDGIVGPYGLSMRKNLDGTHTIIFTLKDAYTVGGFDIYTFNATFGQNNNLGDYKLNSLGPGNPPERDTDFPSTFVNLGDNSGTQGNPFLYYDANGNILSIWTDDEYDSDADTKKLSVYVKTSGIFPTATWSKLVLPDNVNQTGTEAIQPTFDTDGLFFTQDTSVAYCSYSGNHDVAGYGTNGNWSTPQIILQKDTSIPGIKVNTEDVGKIIAIGEPTIANVNGKKILYFVYGYIRGIDSITGIADIDMQAGYIEKK